MQQKVCPLRLAEALAEVLPFSPRGKEVRENSFLSLRPKLSHHAYRKNTKILDAAGKTNGMEGSTAPELTYEIDREVGCSHYSLQKMKLSTVSLGCLVCLIGSFSSADELKAEVIMIEWDHWLWMKRIAVQDPDWTPRDFDPTNRKIRMFERKSATQIYEACGIELLHGESFIYGATTAQLIVRLGRESFRRVREIHRTIRDWKSGRTDRWHLDWITLPKAAARSRFSVSPDERSIADTLSGSERTRFTIRKRGAPGSGCRRPTVSKENELHLFHDF